MRPLNFRQRRFVDEYRQTGNASEAARRAGFSPHSAHNTGGRLLRHPLIRAALAVQAKPEVLAVPSVQLPSGVRLSFSYGERPISPDIALALAQASGDRAELGMWAGVPPLGGLALHALLSHELKIERS